MFIDAKKAHLNPKCLEDVYMELPAECGAARRDLEAAAERRVPHAGARWLSRHASSALTATDFVAFEYFQFAE